jgi:four helix bundle suffix protein
VENAPPEVAANTMLCLVHQTNYLLDQQLRQLEQTFLREGGFTERLYQARQQARALPSRPSFKRNRTNWTDQVGPPASPSSQTNALPPNTGTGADNPPAAS